MKLSKNNNNNSQSKGSIQVMVLLLIAAVVGGGGVLYFSQDSIRGNNTEVDAGGQTATEGSTIVSTGGGSTVSIITNNQLPGIQKELYQGDFEPPNLEKYNNVNDLQPHSLVQKASDSGKIYFRSETIAINGQLYSSIFDINWRTSESRFVFELEESSSSRALLLQFGLPDLPREGSQSEGVYTVRIFTDGELVWAGDSRRSQNSQLYSVPIDITNKFAITIEVTSNGNNETFLYFTKAQILY